MKKGGPHCVFSIMAGLLHQSICLGKELAKQSLTSSRPGMISRSSSPWNLFQSLLKFELSSFYLNISGILCPWTFSILDFWYSFPSFLFFHSFVYSISNQWTFIPYTEQILDFIPRVQNDNTHCQKSGQAECGLGSIMNGFAFTPLAGTY